jgi:hypothetical protein
LIGCKEPVDRKTVVLDSLRKVYADKPIHITLTNTQSGTAPMTDQYAYTDEIKSDLAFKLNTLDNYYKLSFAEGFRFIPTTTQSEEEHKDMLLIQGADGKSGYVHYSFIQEFDQLQYFK